MIVAINKLTGKLITSSENNDIETEKQNALNCGFLENDIEIKEITEEEFKELIKIPLVKSEIEILKEQLEAEKLNSASVSTTLMDFMNFYFEMNPEL